MRGSSMTSRLRAHVGTQDVVRVVVDEEDARARLHALPRSADDEGGLAALGDGEDHVVLREAQVGDLPPAERREVLEALDRLDQRVVAACHHAARAVFPRVGRGRHPPLRASVLPERAPDRIELDAQTAGGAAAGEEDAAAAPEGLDDGAGEPLRLARTRPQVVPARRRRGRRRRASRGRRRCSFGWSGSGGRAGMRGLGDEVAQLEVARDLQEALGALGRGSRGLRHELHRRVTWVRARRRRSRLVARARNDMTPSPAPVQRLAHAVRTSMAMA